MHSPFHRPTHRRASAAVAGGALTIGYATAAFASPASGSTPAEAPAQEQVRASAAIVSPIEASDDARWGAHEIADVEVTPLWEQPSWIRKARGRADDPEVVTAAAVNLRSEASVDAEAFTVLPEGAELGTDADPVTDGDFTLVYTEDGLTGYIATRLLDDYAPAATETSSSTVTASGSSPAEVSAYASSITAAALSRVGSTYAYGGSGPTVFDCSGLVSWAYAQVGKSLPHSSSAIRAVGTVISSSEARPGDVIWSPGHVSIYLGNGQQVEALNPGSGVQQTSIWQSSPVFLRF
ncbi:C40 family peptidase [Demequina phytophila]|uniref:C40 family peptidase n=1 Tax=Demequina phytophila TaxID=1638981 RepID=UPI000784A91B|nr:SH3 domain-containing C40 family peptidase [Demequina phytophila]